MHADTLMHEGHKFNVSIEEDCDSDYPWENSDGHGKVRKSNVSHTSHNSDKKPGERPMNNPGRNEYQFFYNWENACQQAKRDGWNTAPYDAPNRVQRAVQADFDFLSGYINGDWAYVGVTVTLLGDDDEELASESLWSVETYKDYHEETARELASGLLAQRKLELSAEATEATERDYWNSRDVETVAA